MNFTEMLEKKRQVQKKREMQIVDPLALDEDLLLVIARFETAGMDVQQIARAVGRSVLEIESIVASQVYIEHRKDVAQTVAQREVTVDEMYAQMELQALKVMSDYVAAGHDPEYAMRAAQLANRAASRVQTRASVGVNALQANGNQKAAVTLVLNANFVQRLPQVDLEIEAKRSDNFDVGAPSTATKFGAKKIDAVPEAKTVRQKLGHDGKDLLAASIEALGSFALAPAERTI